MYSLGIDVHKDDSQVAVLDKSGELVAEQRLENDQFDELAEAYAGSKATLEATGNSFAIYDVLDQHLDVAVADPRQTKAIGTAEVKKRPIGCKAPGTALQGRYGCGELRPREGRARAPETRPRSEATRGETDGFQARSPCSAGQARYLLRLGSVHLQWRDKLDEVDLTPIGRTLLESFLVVIETLTDRISEMDRMIEETAVAEEETQRLMTVPGVSFFSSVLIVGEIGDITRFDRHEELVSYAGLDPVTRESGDKRQEGGISKHGRSALGWILVQCANVAVKQVKDPYLSRFYGRLKRKKNHQVAIVATARKLLVSIYYMLTRKEVYDPPGVPGWASPLTQL